MARSTPRQESFGGFGWPQEDGPDAGLGPDWSDPRTKKAVARPFLGRNVLSEIHRATSGDHSATTHSESARWPAGPQEREAIGYASDEALQAPTSNVDPEPLAAAAAEIAALDSQFGQTAMSPSEAKAAGLAARDQEVARLVEIARLEELHQRPPYQNS
jgi:hypothetical protein